GGGLCWPADAVSASSRPTQLHLIFSKTRVNPRPIGRGYKRETRSVSSQVWPDFVHILSAFQSLHHLRYRQNRSATRALRSIIKPSNSFRRYLVVKTR